MPGVVEARLAQLNITLPAAPAPAAAYVAWVRTGNLVVTSGQLPFKDGVIAVAGKLGVNVSLEQGKEAARLCAINAIAQLKSAIGDLDKVTRIVRLEGYVHSSAGFQAQPAVLNGASELMTDVFGDIGRHTRVALGIHELPLDAAVQIAVWAEVA